MNSQGSALTALRAVQGILRWRRRGRLKCYFERKLSITFGRKDGGGQKELRKATGWQAHSVRGFLSGALGKKMGLAVASTLAAGQERRYSVKG